MIGILQTQIEIDIIHNWLVDNIQKLNPTKSRYVVYETNKSKDDFSSYLQLEINGNPIPRHKFAKFLGFRVQWDLNWDIQSKAILQQTNHVATKIKRALKYRSGLNTFVAKMIYESFVLSIIRYSALFFVHCSDFNKLKDVHNSFLRFLLNTTRNFPLKLMFLIFDSHDLETIVIADLMSWFANVIFSSNHNLLRKRIINSVELIETGLSMKFGKNAYWWKDPIYAATLYAKK